MSRAAAALAALTLAAGGCPETHAPQALGAVWVVAAAAVYGATPPDRAAAVALAERTPKAALDPAARGQPFGFIATFPRPAGSLQVSLVLYEDSEDGRRVLHADQLDVDADARHLTGMVTPPRDAAWPRACRSYELTFTSGSGDLAAGRVDTAGCPRALEALRGKALFHVGKGGPSLFSFAGTLAAYRQTLGVRPVLRAPLGRAPFFLGWKAAFKGPAGVPAVRVRLAEQGSGAVIDERDLPLDPTWDSLAGGWDIPGAPRWPKAGITYELTVRVPGAAEPLTAPGVADGRRSPALPLAPESLLARGTVVVGH